MYTFSGTGSVSMDRHPIRTGQLAVFGPGGSVIASAADVPLEARSPNLDVLILGGRSIGEPVAWMGSFVMNTREEVQQAFADYRAGRLGSIPAVHGAPGTLVQSRGDRG